MKPALEVNGIIVDEDWTRLGEPVPLDAFLRDAGVVDPHLATIHLETRQSRGQVGVRVVVVTVPPEVK